MHSEMFSLEGKAGIVTGGGDGIGLGMAKGLARAGARVLIAGRDSEKLKNAAGEISGLGAKVETQVVDMSDEASITELAARAESLLGAVDFLFNNAGAIYRTPAEDYPKEKWEYLLKVNLSGPFYLSQKIARQMITRGKGGSIVNTSSMLAVFGGKTVPAYAASKGGITQLTKAMCNDWARYGIRVNAIGPGWIATKMTSALRADTHGRFKEITERIPLGRWGEPEDFEGPAVFLASRASAYITGQVLFVDGGYLAM